METLKHRKGKMLVAKSGILLLIINCCFQIIISCYFQKEIEKNDSYKIEVFKSKNNFSTYLNLQAFHYENKDEKYYSTYWINNLIFSEHNLNDLTFNILPGKFQIECGAIGKETIRLKNFEVKRGDSIIVSFFLKNSKEVLINNEGMVIKHKKSRP